MRYTLTWLQSAQDKLAAIYNNATDKAAVTHASNRMEKLLRTSSALRGNDTSGVYQLTAHPLRFVYIVTPLDMKVTVVRVDFLG